MVKTSLVTALIAVPWAAAAQEPAPAHVDLRQAIFAAQPQSYHDPECGLKPGHFRVKGAAVYLVTATENPANRERLLGDAQRTLEEAIRENDQGDNPGAWYILGRVNLYQGDVLGADTAFAHAEALAPECKEEMRRLRRNTWIPIRQRALLLLQESQPDSAVATYRLGLAIYHGEPDAYFVMATLLDAQNATDSMAPYLRKAIEITDPADKDQNRLRMTALRRLAGIYTQAGEVDSAAATLGILAAAAQAAADTGQWVSAESQIARVFFEAKRYPEALAAFRQMAQLRPGDESITRNIATVFQAAGQIDSAQAVLAGLGGAAPKMDTTSAAFLINRGAGRYQAKNFEGAAADFSSAIEAEPSNRLAMFNLGLAYNELHNGSQLVATAKRLIAREPLHEMSHRLLVQGYLYAEDQDNAKAAVRQLDGLRLLVDSLGIQPGPQGMAITGVAMARNKPAPAMTLVFEFLGADGAPVTSVDVAVPALAAGATHPFRVEGTGAGIVNWRYRSR